MHPMVDNSLPPQVHFIANKQQFITQIAAESLLPTEKRPGTAQNITKSRSSKRVTQIYGGMPGIPPFGNLNSATYNPFSHLGKHNPAKTFTHGFAMHSGPPSDDKNHSGKAPNRRDVGLAHDASFEKRQQLRSQIYDQGPVKMRKREQRGRESSKDESIRYKMISNQLREDSVKLKTRVKILENELGRKEKIIEDFITVNAPTRSSLPSQPASVQSAQKTKYQQETFLVMALKKQVRELKGEVGRRDEELDAARKNMKHTSIQEKDYEVAMLRDECSRLRDLIDEMRQMKAAELHDASMEAIRCDLHEKGRQV